MNVGDIVRITDARWNHHIGQEVEVLEINERGIIVQIHNPFFGGLDYWEFRPECVTRVSPSPDDTTDHDTPPIERRA